jgi:hypothetical protein
MKYILVLVFMLVFGFRSKASSVTVSGNLSGTWSADTVLVEGNLLVPAGELLLIPAGTLVQFQSYYRIDVQGRILAQGAMGDTIIFTVRDTSNFNAQEQGRGGWSGIRFGQIATNQDSSVFSFCRFEFGKATEDSTNCYGGAIYAHDFGKLRFDNCLFFHNYSFFNGGAVYLNNSGARIEKCSFVSNYSGNTGTVYGYGGGICSMNSAPIVRNNQFYKNSSTGVGGAVSFDNSDPVFENNIMQLNYSALGGALGILRSTPAQALSNNLITHNAALFFGGGICCIRSFPVFSNITISNNDAAYAGGFYCNDSAAPSMYNSIIWGNTGFGSSVYIWDVFSAPNFYYCDIEGDTTGFEGSGAHQGYHGQYQYNLNENPGFIGSGLFPFQLLASSACIDAGTPDANFLNLPNVDLAGAQRIENSRIDLGAYEFNGTTAIKHFNKESESLEIYPNPFKQSVTVVLPVSAGPTTEIVILDMQGNPIRKMVLETKEPTFTWNGCNEANVPVAKGVYFLLIKTNSKTYFGKVIK